MEDEQIYCDIMMDPKLSVIIPAFNAENTLERCIKSILRQSFSDYEIIIIDDGSTDSSREISDLYCRRDKRMQVVHQNNSGVSVARNVGINIASGQYIMFVDSDDEIESSFFAEYIEAVEKTNCDIIIGGYTKVSVDESKSEHRPNKQGIYGKEIWEDICREPEQYGYICSKLFKRDIIKKKSLQFRIDMYSQEDFDFCLSYFRYCSKFGFISNAGYQYYYFAGKRIPPVWNFVENQLKLLKLAKASIKLSEESQNAIRARINLLIYSSLYDADTLDRFENTISKLNYVEGLNDYLSGTRIRDEKSMITSFFMKGQYKLIYRYFKIRNSIRDIIR